MLAATEFPVAAGEVKRLPGMVEPSSMVLKPALRAASSPSVNRSEPIKAAECKRQQDVEGLLLRRIHAVVDVDARPFPHFKGHEKTNAREVSVIGMPDTALQ